MRNGIDTIKVLNSVTDVLRRYGVKVKHNRCDCFYQKHRHSQTVAISEDSFYCFACGKGGDVFSIVQHFENCEFAQAYKILGGEKQPSFKAMREAEKKRNAEAVKRVRQKQKEEAFLELARLDREIILNRPENADTEPCSAFFDALKKISYQAYICDTME